MTPATIAVSNTGPLGERRPLSRSASATAWGNSTRASASAVRLLAVLSLTSTIAGRRSESTCENVMESSADVIHFDLLFGIAAAAQRIALFAVAVRSIEPGAANQL